MFFLYAVDEALNPLGGVAVWVFMFMEILSELCMKAARVAVLVRGRLEGPVCGENVCGWVGLESEFT